MSRRTALAAVTALYAIALAGAVSGADTPTPTASGKRRPNVVLITVDTLRPDALGWIDGERSTPAIDTLAAGGFRFPTGVAPVPLTLPSHASLLTGLEPQRHGVHNNGQRLDGRFETVAERLRASGYATGAFVSGYPLSEPFGTAQGFDRYDDALDDGEGAWLERRAPATTDAALQWLATAPSPWLLWIHYYDPHLPYDAPSTLVGQGFRAPYDAEVRLVDREIGRLRHGLIDASATDTGATLTVFAADHGESLGEHGEASHGYFIYDSTLVVPMILHLPGVIAPGESAAGARLVDLAPTILDLVGVEAPQAIDGVSLAPLLRGRAQEVPAAAIESVQPWASYGWSPLVGVRRAGWKYIAAPRPELYDLRTDPGETTNLVADRAALAAELRSLVSAPASLLEPTADAADPDALERLRALGYTGGGNTAGELPDQLADPKDQLRLRELLTEAERALEAGDLRRAVRLCDDVLKEDRRNRFALSRSAMALIQAGFADRAIPRLRRVLELDPEQSESRRLLAEALTRTRSWDEALTHWRELVAQRPEDADLWSQLGSTLGLAGQPAQATEALAEALRRDPGNPERHIRLGFALHASGEPGEAADELLAALAATGESSFRHFGALGALLLKADRVDEAHRYLERSRPDHHDYAEGRFEWALWAAGRGDLETAERRLREAVAVRPELAAKARAHAELAALVR